MTRATLILAVALLLIAALAESEHRRDPAPLVHAAWTCPKLPNPCDRIDCHRVNPGRIA